MPADYRLGFESIDDETRTSCTVEGALPAWLHGSLVRTGPARFQAGDVALRHWFDGLAMLHAFRFDGGSGDVRYANRFLRSKTYRSAQDDGTIHASEFATDPCRSLFGRVMAMFTRETPTDNANVSVGRLAGQHVAMTETPMPVAFDPETLETLGVVDPDGRVQGQITTAHPHTDPDTGVTYTYYVDFGPTSHYRVYATDPATPDAPTELAALEVAHPAYMHSFGMTENHLVLAEFPLRVHPLQMLFMPLTGNAFIDAYRWTPEQGTRFTVLDKKTGDVVKRAQGPAFFAFHHVNAFERDGDLVVDLVAHDDASIIDRFYLDRLRAEDGVDGSGTLRRVTLPLDGGDVATETRSETPIELPRIHDAHAGHAYRYVYGNGTRQPGNFQDQLVKVDVERGATQTWHAPHTYPSEPVFVPHPDAAGRDAGAEDDGVVLSVVLDAERETSFLLVLDAATMDEVARADAPHAIPHGLHGAYWS